MKAILNNPYRIIGVLVGTPAREQERQIKRLKHFIEAEQEVIDDFSFSNIGELIRTQESINEAASKLNLDKDKMDSALFWFYIGNNITDEPALESLKQDRQENTIKIWSKLVSNAEVSSRNCSAFHNLSNLFLQKAFSNSNINYELLEQGINLKLKFLESDYIKSFKLHVTDSTFKTTKKNLQLSFLNQVAQEIEGYGKNALINFFEILNILEFELNAEFKAKFVQKPIANIERKITETKLKRESDNAKSEEYAIELIKIVEPEILLLKSIINIADIKFVTISDKIANEVLQCGIDLFNLYYETEVESGGIAQSICDLAENYAKGNIIIERLDRTKSIIKNYNENISERNKSRKVKDELSIINSNISQLEESINTVTQASSFAHNCLPILKIIKSKLSPKDDFYIQISSKVVKTTTNILIDKINEAQRKRKHYLEYKYKKYEFPNLKEVPLFSQESLMSEIKYSWKVFVFLSQFDMTEADKKKFKNDKETLKDIHKELFKNEVFFGDWSVSELNLWIVGIVIIFFIILLKR